MCCQAIYFSCGAVLRNADDGVCTVDLRPGGTFHCCMRTPDGHEMWGKWIFREIAPPERLVFLVSFSDPGGGMTRHPMSATWPLETLSTCTFEGRDGHALLTVRWSAHNPTDAERETFDSGHEAMRQGWTGTFDQLDAYLARASAKS